MTEHDTFTDAETANLLRMAGLTPDMAEHFSTPSQVVDVVEVVTPEAEATVAPAADIDALATQLLAKAKGNIDTAKQLAIKWASDEFDKVKLSKIEAARLGVDKTAHNKTEYARIQGMREKLNSAMRKQARGHVATKITKTSNTNPELDAFLLANQGNPLIEQILALQNK